MKIEILNPIPLLAASVAGFGFNIQLDRSPTLITIEFIFSCPVYVWEVSAEWAR